MKRFLAIIILTALLVGVVPVNAAETVTISASGITKILASSYNSGEVFNVEASGRMSFQPGNYAEYKVTVAESGMYNLSAEVAAKDETNIGRLRMSVSIDGESIGSTALRVTGSYNKTCPRHLTRIYLEEGVHTIRITNEEGGYYFDYITFSRRENEITDLSLVEAEHYIYGGEAEEDGDTAVTETTSSQKTVVAMSAGDWLVFDMTVPSGGEYRLELNAASAGDASIGYAAQNGINCGSIDIRNTGSLSQYGKSIAFVNLSEGKNNFKIGITDGEINLDSFSLTAVESGNKESFLNDVNTAETEDEIKAAYEKYGALSGIDMTAELASLFYPDPMFSRLLQKNFKGADEAINSFYDSLLLELSLPMVTAYVGRTQVFCPTAGDMSFYVTTSMLEDSSVIILALYKDNSLYKYTAAERTNEVYLNPKISGVEIAEGDNVSFKLFCWENLDTIRPHDVYPDVYEEIFVSASGSEAGDGTEENPYDTIKKAKEKIAQINSAQNGDIVVNIDSGYYFLEETEVFAPEHSGKNGYNVIFRGTDSENPPIIGGGVEITGWTHESGGIYKASLPGLSGIRNLYIDGKPAVRARSEETYTVSTLYSDGDSTYETDGITVASSGFPTLTYPLGAELVWNQYWYHRRASVTGISKSGSEYTLLLEPVSFSRMLGSDKYYYVNPGRKFYIENDLSLLDTPGEFYFDETTDELYYMPTNLTELSKPAFVPVTEGLIEVTGNSIADKTENIIFENLDIRYGAWTDVNELGFAGIQADAYLNATSTTGTLGTAPRLMMPAQVKVNMADGIEFKNCQLSCLGSSAVSMTNAVTNSKLTGNVIKDVSGSGVVIGTWNRNVLGSAADMCRNLEVSNNVIRRIGNEYLSSVAVSVYYENSITVSHNDIADIPYTGISVGWGWGNADVEGVGNINVRNNKIVDIMKQMGDGAHVYTLGPLRDSSISENYFEKSGDSSYGGIYTDSGSAYLNVYKNVIIDCERWFFTGIGTGVGLVRDMKVFDNYSTTQDYSEGGTDNSYEDAVLITSVSASEEAQAIKNGAGVEEDYHYLLEKAS